MGAENLERRISSSANLKYRGDVMSPCTTPRFIGNASDMTFLPSASCTSVTGSCRSTVDYSEHRSRFIPYARCGQRLIYKFVTHRVKCRAVVEEGQTERVVLVHHVIDFGS